MKVYKVFFVVLACFFVLFLSITEGYSQASCTDPVMIAEDGFVFSTIQGAYDDASLRWSDFTLLLVSETFTEDLIIDNGSVLLDGGYDCSFSTKTLSTGILGSITISAGAVTFDNIAVLSTAVCAFDNDNDGFTSIGSCTGSADDCNDNNDNVFPGNPEICDGLDNNCDGQVDEGLSAVDIDGDGYSAVGSCGGSADDCNDGNPNINPGAVDIPYDGIDQDCSGADLTFAGESCVDCHDPESSWISIHDLTTPPDGTCAACHAAPVNNVLSGHYGKTVRTDGNNMPAGSTIVCESCHDPDAANHTGGIALGTGTNFVGSKISSAYPNITCDTCHENRAALHSSAHSVEVGPNDLSYDPPGQLCSVCHIVANWSDIEGTEHNVDTNGDGSCATCHNSPRTEVQITISAGTPPIHCLDCHSDKYLTVHGSHDATVFVWTASCGTASCHNEAGNANISTTVHSGCTTCHVSNAGGLGTTIVGSSANDIDGDARLAAGPGYATSTCLTCHPAGTYSWEAIHTSTATAVDHSTSVADLASCTTSCHETTGGNTQIAVDGTPGNEVHDACTSCHTSTGALDTSKNGTGIVLGTMGSGNCGQCHGIDYFPQHSHDHSTTVTGSADCVGCHAHDDPQIIAGIHSNTCATCHSSSTPEVIAAIASGQAECIDCHAAHDGPAIHATLGAPESCEACHTDKITGTDFTYIINNHGPHPTLGYTELDRCQRCHNSSLPEVVNTIQGAGGSPVYCTDCHVNQHVAITDPFEIHDYILTSTGSTCGICHIENYWTHTDMNATASCAACHDSANQDEFNALHQNDCLVCHLSQRSEVITAIHDGIAGTPVECATCHGSDPAIVHPSCTTCHGEPPDGTSPPNTEGAHADHAALGYGSVDPSCGACHDGAVHYNGTADIGILSNFDAQSGPAIASGDGTCSSTRCHGGQTTPDWLTGSIDVDTDCTSCHKRRTGSTPDQYNDYSSGQHSKHVVSEGIACIKCHNTATLQSGHFMNLESSGFELDPAATIGGGTTQVPSGYSGTCTLTCHGESHNNDSWSGGH